MIIMCIFSEKLDLMGCFQNRWCECVHFERFSIMMSYSHFPCSNIVGRFFFQSLPVSKVIDSWLKLLVCAHVFRICLKPAQGGPRADRYKWRCNFYKWPYKWVPGVITLLIGVIISFITGRGPTLHFCY